MCQVRLDRIQILAETKKARLPAISGFRIMWDSFVRRQTSIQTYRRVRSYENPQTGTKIYIQYQPACPWLSPAKITVVADDRRPLLRRELEEILKGYAQYRLLLVELAVDFSPGSGVDRCLVRRHGRFGRSRLNPGRPGSLWYGTRRSGKLVRCYRKPEVEAYRVELEVHSPLIRKHGLQSLEALRRLPALLYPAHLQFMRLDWVALYNHLLRRRLPAKKILREAKSYAWSIHGLMGFLRHELGLRNVHRFLVPLEMNEQIRLALENWSRRW